MTPLYATMMPFDTLTAAARKVDEEFDALMRDNPLYHRYRDMFYEEADGALVQHNQYLSPSARDEAGLFVTGDAPRTRAEVVQLVEGNEERADEYSYLERFPFCRRPVERQTEAANQK